MKLTIDEVTKLIRDAPIGEYIGDAGSKILAERAAQNLDLLDNEALYEKGSSTNSFYIIIEGRLAIMSDPIRDRANPGILHVLEKGDLVGELSFIDGSSHGSTVRSLGQSRVISFNKSDIDPLINEHPLLVFNFMRAIIKRVHSTLMAINAQQSELLTYISTGGRGRL